METNKQNHSSEVVPSLIKAITANEVVGFDSSKEHDDVESQLKSTCFTPLNTSVIVSHFLCHSMFVHLSSMAVVGWLLTNVLS